MVLTSCSRLPKDIPLSVHQLQVVYDDDFDSVLANQSACFCPKFKNGKAGGIVYIYRSVPQYFDTRHEPFPFERGQLSAFDFIAGDFASVDDETIDKVRTLDISSEKIATGVL